MLAVLEMETEGPSLCWARPGSCPILGPRPSPDPRATPVGALGGLTVQEGIERWRLAAVSSLTDLF